MKRAIAVATALVTAATCLGATSVPSRSSSAAEQSSCGRHEGTVAIAQGATLFGEDGVARPGHRTQVPAFRIDRTEVTNRQFAAFVMATGYVTDAERQGEGAVFIQPERLEYGLSDPRGWWHMVKGATWRHPQGPDSSIKSQGDLPVVQVTYNDASAYARWRGGALPTELQWERAARAEQKNARDRHLWARKSDGTPQANIWDGLFPLVNTREDGFAGVAPVGCFSPNGLGLYDTVGNVWEWTRSDAGSPGPLRGGSYLCSRNYCANYAPAGRQVQEGDLATSHAGFRVVYPVS
ncbi:MAG: SUMF1/EgtB/PvdO family nonheme iron enzyme [Novosphingobium sp.]